VERGRHGGVLGEIYNSADVVKSCDKWLVILQKCPGELDSSCARDAALSRKRLALSSSKSRESEFLLPNSVLLRIF
jgi:hypothetical protein